MAEKSHIIIHCNTNTMEINIYKRKKTGTELYIIIEIQMNVNI